jgi:ADP-ribose pyrophosphatase YjhB (NUDIX family)
MLPQLSVDTVVFGFHDDMLKVLLLKFRNLDYWALPGGFVLQHEDLDAAARRVLFERTGLHDIYLEQFYAFGQHDRDYSKVHQQIMAAVGRQYPPDHWILKRFVSVGYYALVDFMKVSPSPDALSDTCDWFDIESMPSLVFDHNQVFQKALEALRTMLDHKLVGFNLLPETFTMGELQKLYETILGKKLLRTNFQRKMLSLEILERVEKKYSGGAHKAPYLYRFDQRKGEDFLKERG